MFGNIPQVKLGLIAVSRDCFPIGLATARREAVTRAYDGKELYNCQITVENEADAVSAVRDVQAVGCNALVVFLGNFGPETPETLLAQRFGGPVMYLAAAEGDGNLINGRGDAYCGLLNCAYDLGLRHLKAYIPADPVVTADEAAEAIRSFLPIARALIGLKSLKIFPFGPRPQDFFACNAPIQGLYKRAWRWRKTASWICWCPIARTPRMRVSKRSARTWQGSLARRAINIRSCCHAWRSLS